MHILYNIFTSFQHSRQTPLPVIMSEYGGKLAEGMYKMNFVDMRLAAPEATQQQQRVASPGPLDETSMPTFPGIESWLHLVQPTNDVKIPLDVMSEHTYIRVESPRAAPIGGDEDETTDSPSTTSSPKMSFIDESVQRRASGGAFTTASSRSSACTSLDCDIRVDEAVSKQWEKKGEAQTMEQAECDCLQRTASLLGDLGDINARSHSKALDDLVRFSREAVSTCRHALDCAQCVSSRPANALLLCMASKYISMLYERISLSYDMMERTAKFGGRFGEYNGDASYDDNDDDDDDNDDDEDEEEDDEKYFAERNVEGWDEERLYGWFETGTTKDPHKRLRVIRCIIRIQLSRFIDLSQTLKSEPLEGEYCASLLTEAEGRMARLSAQMKQQAAAAA